MIKNKKLKFMLRFLSIPTIVLTILVCFTAALGRIDIAIIISSFALGTISMLGWSILIGMFLTMKGVRK